MFEHSVKVPRHYKIAANIFKKVSTEGGSVKTLLYDNKLRHFRTDVLFAIITEAIKHVAELDKIFESCKLLENEPRLDPWLAKILTTELLYGKKELPGKSKPEQTILLYKNKFENYKSEHQDESIPEATPRPRYIRINTNLLTTSDAIRTFQDEGYRFIRCTSGSYNDYLEQVKNLTEYDFTQDYHVKTVFVFPPGTKLHNHELYLENKIILQNKASTLSVHLLAPPAGSVVLDMCAAPGMKTTQLAAYLRNNGKIYAVERNEKRYETLCDFVRKTASNCVETIHKDCLELKRGDYDDVEYILLDPSCSGSGMDISVHKYIDQTRLARLTSLQEKFLKHAMNAFPKAKRIVYSTCSMFPEENERVITNVVKTSRAKWRVQEVKNLLKGQWNNFGSAMYGSMGTRCLYAKPESDLTTGFFLAVLDRDEKDLEKTLIAETEKKENVDHKKMKQRHMESINGNHNESYKNKKNKQDISSNISEVMETTDSVEDGVEDTKQAKKKKKRDENASFNQDETVENCAPNPVDMDQPVKKKKKKRKLDAENDINVENLEENLKELAVDDAVSDEPVKKKKKKKDKKEIAKHDGEVETIVETKEVSQMDGATIEDNSESPPKKKKKRKNKEREKSEPEKHEVNNEMVIDEPPKKKKKKKHNDMEVC